ncbi:MAG: C40 family peptidase [Zoogloeaceae bacterium]|jgi:cell wall-associated NlpC family hydrolase|nr:C40 family peptidase [Zoogloeaceae bacterium]
MRQTIFGVKTRAWRLGGLFLLLLALVGCGVGAPLLREKSAPAASTSPFARNLEATPAGREVVMYALGLIGTGYRFGGKNPSAGLDCSGMVSYIYRQAAQYALTGSAADMAKKGRAVRPEQIRPGDLLFFNTLNRPRSHVAVYIGDLRFVHAPSSNGAVRIDSMEDRYYSSRFEEARSYFGG